MGMFARCDGAFNTTFKETLRKSLESLKEEYGQSASQNLARSGMQCCETGSCSVRILLAVSFLQVLQRALEWLACTAGKENFYQFKLAFEAKLDGDVS
jgi:hypothetical protein